MSAPLFRGGGGGFGWIFLVRLFLEFFVDQIFFQGIFSSEDLDGCLLYGFLWPDFSLVSIVWVSL